MSLDALQGGLTVLLIAAFGLVLMLLVRRDRRLALAEGAGLTLALGLGSVGTVLFWCSLAGFTPSIGLQLGLLVAAAPCLWLAGRKCAPAMPPQAKLSRAGQAVAAIALVLVVAAAAAVIVPSLSTDIYEWDGFAIWGLKGRALAVQPLLQQPEVFFNPAVEFSHPDYPLLFPMLIAAFYAAADAFNDPAAKCVFALTLIALLALLYGSMSRLTGRCIAAVCTALFAVAPATIRWAGTGYVDIGVALYACGTAAYLALFIREGRRSDAVIALLFALFLSLTKNEGRAIALGLVVPAVLLHLRSRDRGRLKFLLAAAAAAGLLLTPFLIWVSGVPHAQEDYGRRLFSLFSEMHVQRIPEILRGAFAEGSNVAHWGILWYLPAAALLASPRRLLKREVLFLVCGLLAQFVAYVAAFTVSPHTPAQLLGATLDRLALQASPVALLLAGLCLAREPLDGEAGLAADTAAAGNAAASKGRGTPAAPA